MSCDNIRHSESAEIQLRLINKRALYERTHNLPSTSEVATLIVGDLGSVAKERDIVFKGRDGRLQHISELHPCYLAL